MTRYRFVNDFRGAAGRFLAGDEIELDPGDRLVVDGFVVPVAADAPDDAPVIEITGDDAPAPKVRRAAKKTKG